MLSADRQPLPEGIPLQLVSKGAVVASAKTDAAGVAAFDVEPLQVGPVAVRLDASAVDKGERGV